MRTAGRCGKHKEITCKRGLHHGRKLLFELIIDGPPAGIVSVGGYRFVIDHPPALHAIRPAFLGLTVTRPDGSPARFTPWFGALAHAIFFRAGSLDYFHTHVCSAGMSGCTSVLGSTRVTGRATRPGQLRVGVLLPVPGIWRLFLQCKVDGRVLTAPFTLVVR